MSTQPASPQPAQAVQSPEVQRALFLRNSLRESLPLDPLTSVVGGTPLTVRVPGVGVGRFLRLFVQATITVTPGTGTVALSSKGPYNLIQRVQYRDPAGNPRVDCTGYELYLLHIVKDLYSGDPLSAGPTGVSYPYSASLFSAPIATGANAWTFWVDVPFEMGPLDPRGLLVLESATANSYCYVTLNASGTGAISGANLDSPIVLTGNATAVITAINITPVYYYYVPLMSGNPPSIALPAADLSVIQEVMSRRQQGGLAPGTDNAITMETGRTFYRVICQLVANGQMVTGIINGAAQLAGATAVKWRYDAKNITLFETLQAYLARVRDDYNRDLPQGVFLFDLTSHPWDSRHWGQLDAILTLDSGISTVNPFYIDVIRQTLYTAPRTA